MEIDWKKKYEEALERARALREEAIEKEYVNDYEKDYEAIFPELAESEDEKIRREIVSFIRAFWVDHRDSVPQTSKWLDWLEKQKEQKNYNKLYEDIAKSEWFKKAYKGKSLGCDYEQKEQKPGWSEEDDAHLKWLCGIIHSRVVNKKMSLAEESELGNWMDKWLNHKPQPRWKPTEEQMRCLEMVLTDEAMDDNVHDVLSGMREQLKKLM